MKYIDPKNFRLKDNIDWKAQAANIKEIAGIAADIVKETDWSDVAKSCKKDAVGIKKRLSHELDLLKNMSPDEISELSGFSKRRIEEIKATIQ